MTTKTEQDIEETGVCEEETPNPRWENEIVTQDQVFDFLIHLFGG